MLLVAQTPEQVSLHSCKRFPSLYGLRLTPSRFGIQASAEAVLLGFEIRAKLKKMI